MDQKAEKHTSESREKNDKLFAAFALSAATILFLLKINLQIAYLSQGLILSNVIYSVIIILMIATYALISIDYKKKEILKVHSMLLFISIAVFLASYLIQPSLATASLLQTFDAIFNEYIYLPIILLIVFLGSCGAYLIRIKKNLLFGYAIFIAIFLLLVIIMTGVLHLFYPSDETLLSFYGMQLLMHGSNPYNTSIAGTVYNLFRFGNVSASVTTINTPAGSVFQYPSFELFSSIPFYLLSQPTLYNLEHIDLPIQLSALSTLLLFVLLMGIRKEEILKPKFFLVIFLTLFASFIPSAAIFLMALLLYLAYLGIKSKYAWLLIGLAVSLQQELWFPCLLLIIYSFNNYGTKKSMKTLIGAAVVFLVLNLYFILLNPVAYVNSTFLGSVAHVFPSIESPIGYFLLSNYHVLIGSLSTIFILVMLLLIIIFAALNRKEFVLLFSVIPYFFFSHALSTYYTLPLLVFLAVLYSPQIKEGSGRFMRYLSSNRTAIYSFYIAIFLVSLFSILILYESHLAYTNTFNVSITNQTLISTGNTTIYTANLVYKNPDANYVYFGLYTISGYKTNEYGFYLNQILSNNQSICNSYNCTISMNRIAINKSANSYEIRAVFRPYDNQSISTAAGVLYNYNYFYLSNAAYNTT